MELKPFNVGANGMTEELFSYEEAIRQFAYIELPFDGDDDGKNDLIRVDIIRPRELDGKAKVPLIMDPSPYYERLDRHGEQKKYLHEDDKWNSPLVQFPFFFDNYFVPRGYAVAMVDTSGTALSQGFCDIGGRRDVASANAVVDWVNGRAKAYLTRDDRSESNRAYADWCTGSVAAIGKSYDGSVPNGMAATGIEGLKTIVPISAISSQYDWYHPNGCLLDGDDADGGWYEPYNFAEFLQSTADGKLQRFTTADDGYKLLKAGSDHEQRCYNEFWDERNYRARASKFKASVFIVHGVNDLNVMMNQVDKYWQALGEAGVPRKIWLHQYGHDDPFDVRHHEWVRTLNRWFDHWLLDVDNGIMDEPEASIEGTDGVWKDYASWPVPGATMRTLAVRGGEDPRLGRLAEASPADSALFATDGCADASEARPASTAAPQGSPAAALGAAMLSQNGAAAPVSAPAPASAQSGTASVAHLKAGRLKELTPLAEADKPADDRLLYVSAPLAADVHLSGTPRLSLRLKTSEGDTNITAQLIEYGEGNYVQVNPDLHALVELKETRTCGQSSNDDKPTYPVCVPRRSCEVEHVVTRGWLATAHASSFKEFQPLKPGEWTTLDIPMLATDWTIKAGHRIALRLANSTTRLAKVNPADFDIDLDSLVLTLPLA